MRTIASGIAQALRNVIPNRRVAAPTTAVASRTRGRIGRRQVSAMPVTTNPMTMTDTASKE